MPKLVYSLICSDVIIDSDSGSASYIKVFEHGTVPKLPAQVPPFFVATLWELDEGSTEPFTVGLTLVSPDGKKDVLGKNEVQGSGAALHKLNFRMPGLKVEAEGRHEIIVSVKRGEKQAVAARMPLHIFLQPPAKEQ